MDGAYGGFVTSSHLQLSLTPQHHGVVVTCDASNDIGNQRAHDAVTLSIARKFFLTLKVSQMYVTISTKKIPM